jgi:class 3 adenylate cyclase
MVFKLESLSILETAKAAGPAASSLPTGTVTFLFTDIVGSTSLWEKMPNEMQASLAQHHTILRQAIEANGGQVFQIIGDAFQAAFRLAPQALAAAVAAQSSLQAANWDKTGPIQVRMGLHRPAELTRPKRPLCRESYAQPGGPGDVSRLWRANSALMKSDLVARLPG